MGYLEESPEKMVELECDEKRGLFKKEGNGNRSAREGGEDRSKREKRKPEEEVLGHLGENFTWNRSHVKYFTPIE